MTNWLLCLLVAPPAPADTPHPASHELAEHGGLVVPCLVWRNLQQAERPQQPAFRDAELPPWVGRPWVGRLKHAGRTWQEGDMFPMADDRRWTEPIPFRGNRIGPKDRIGGDGTLPSTRIPSRYHVGFRDRQATGQPAQPAEFAHAGVLAAWRDYAGRLSFGKGQTLALVDDGCKMSMPEWQAVMADGRAKVRVTYDAVDGDANPQHEGRGYHGSTIGIPSSVNHSGKWGVAYNNQLAVIRGNECCHCSIENSRKSLAAALQWVLDHHQQHRITVVNLAPVDDREHAIPVATEIDSKLAALRKAGIWVSAPAGNHNFTGGISWPASQPDCFAIGAVRPGSKDVVYLDRHEKVALLVPARATSSSNAIACGAAMILREAIETSGYDWKNDGPTLPEAMMSIFRRTGVEATDPAVADRTFRRLHLARAIAHVLPPAADSETPDKPQR